MGFKITVQRSRHAFQAEPDESILDAALRQGVLIPYGCRNGACGMCRGRVLEGQVDYRKGMPPGLGEADRQAGFALFCCAHARGDVTIECSELASAQELPVKTLPAKVQRMTRAAADVMIVELKLPPGERLAFFAGQYIDILLKDGRRRAFSLANPPHADDLLQLHIRLVPGGRFTGQVFASMREKDLLRIRGPHGSFYLREESAKPLLLVAGGTGFAPIKAIVEHAITENLGRPMAVYWGARRREDLYMPGVAERWAAACPHLRFVPVLSEASEGDTWNGREGLVHEAAMADFPDLSGHQAYVCGSPAMVAAARRDFVGKCALPENEFFADAFEFASDADIR